MTGIFNVVSVYGWDELQPSNLGVLDMEFHWSNEIKQKTAWQKRSTLQSWSSMMSHKWLEAHAISCFHKRQACLWHLSSPKSAGHKSLREKVSYVSRGKFFRHKVNVLCTELAWPWLKSSIWQYPFKLECPPPSHSLWGWYRRLGPPYLAPSGLLSEGW